MADLNPTFSDLTPSVGSNFDVSAWFNSEAVPLVPDTVAPFLAAHGFLVVNGTEQYIDGEFSGYLLNMQRQSFQHADSIQILLNAMTFAYNEGRSLNDTRYEDILAGRQSSLEYQQDEVDATETVFDAQYTLMISDLDAITADAPTLAEWTSALDTLNTKLDEYDSDVADLIASYEFDETALTTAITTAFTNLTTALGTYRGEVATLKTEQSAIETTIQGILATETSDLASHDTEIDTALDALDAQYTIHLASANAALADMETAIAAFATASTTIIAAMEAAQTAHEGTMSGLFGEVTTAFELMETNLLDLLSTLRSDYTTHSATATAFLTDLGTTELARINERYDNLKAANNQRLVDRGFSSAAITTQMETQVERERNEAIGELNDRLNREKFENQHRLYAQQQEMRGTHAAVYGQLGAAEHEAIKFRTSSTDQLNAQSQDIRRASLQSRQETERLRIDLYRAQMGVAETFNKIFIDIKSTIVSGLGQLQQARLAVTRGQSGDYNQIFGQILETFTRSLSGEDRFAALEAQLRERQQGTLSQIEEIGQSWARTQGGLLETGISRRGDSARVDAQVRQAYYDTILRQRMESAQGRLASVTAKANLLDSHINETTRVAAALFDFAERREDSYPSIGDMAALVASLGDDN